MDDPTPGFPLFDYNLVKIEGTGVYVGDQFTVLNPEQGWWGEGDEKVYVDGEEITSMKAAKAAVFRRRKVGIVYQFYNLIPVLTLLLGVWLLREVFLPAQYAASALIIAGVLLSQWRRS